MQPWLCPASAWGITAVNSNKNSLQWDPRSVTVVYITEGTTHTPLTLTKAGEERKLSNQESVVCSTSTLPEPVSSKPSSFSCISIYSCLSPTIHSPTTSRPEFIYFFPSFCLLRPSTSSCNDTLTSQITTCGNCQTLAQNPQPKRQSSESPKNPSRDSPHSRRDYDDLKVGPREIRILQLSGQMC